MSDWQINDIEKRVKNIEREVESLREEMYLAQMFLLGIARKLGATLPPGTERVEERLRRRIEGGGSQVHL